MGVIRTHNQNKLKPGSSNGICDICGFKFKREDLRKRWDDAVVCRKHWETKHPSLTYNYKSRDEGAGGKSFGRTDSATETGGTDVEGNTFPPTFVVDPYTFSDAETGTSFIHQHTVSGGVAVLWEVTAGAIPTGTVLNISTGRIEGTLTTAESVSYTLQATDQLGNTDTESFTMTISEAWADLISATGPAFWYKFGKGSDFTNYATTATGVKDAELEPTPPNEGTAQTDTFITATSGPGGNFPDAGDFNGSTSFMYQGRYTDIGDLPGTPAATGHLMIEAVVWLDVLGSGKTYSMCSMGPYLTGAGSNRGWRIWVDGSTGNLRYQILGSQQADYWGCQSLVFPTGQWVHVMINMAVRPPDYPGENFIYVNGVSQTVTKVSGNDYATAYGDSPLDLRIGCQREYSGAYTDGEPYAYWDGKISEIIGWQSDNNTDGFSSTDIEAHYAASGL